MGVLCHAGIALVVEDGGYFFSLDWIFSLVLLFLAHLS
jgi:hypothetical protein